ncbi:hypothetical protein B0H13DRAFT_1915207 [Mycena leptocephala]|nr:hypothetical protein B0H13DRAFT_1915207 [Mycena leptocephala]
MNPEYNSAGLVCSISVYSAPPYVYYGPLLPPPDTVTVFVNIATGTVCPRCDLNYHSFGLSLGPLSSGTHNPMFDKEAPEAGPSRPSRNKNQWMREAVAIDNEINSDDRAAPRLRKCKRKPSDPSGKGKNKKEGSDCDNTEYSGDESEGSGSDSEADVKIPNKEVLICLQRILVINPFQLAESLPAKTVPTGTLIMLRMTESPTQSIPPPSSPELDEEVVNFDDKDDEAEVPGANGIKVSVQKIVNPSYSAFVANKSPEVCPLGAFAFYHHYIHDVMDVASKLKIDWSVNKSWRQIRVLYGPKSPNTPYNEHNLYNLYRRAVLDWVCGAAYFDTYAPALPKKAKHFCLAELALTSAQAILGATGFKVEETYDPVWTRVHVPQQFLELICPKAESIWDEMPTNLSGAFNYWQMCGAAICQKCPKSALFRLPAFCDTDARNWIQSSLPSELSLLQVKEGSPAGLLLIQNTVLRKALEDLYKLANIGDGKLTKLTELLERLTAVLSPAQGFSTGSYLRNGITPSAPILLHFYEQMEETGKYESSDADGTTSIRAFVTGSPRYPDEPRAPTQVDLVLPPTEAFYKPGTCTVAQHWGRYREIPEWIERESSRRTVSPSVVVTELEAMRVVGDQIKGMNWFRQETATLRKQAAKAAQAVQPRHTAAQEEWSSHGLRVQSVGLNQILRRTILMCRCTRTDPLPPAPPAPLRRRIFAAVWQQCRGDQTDHVAFSFVLPCRSATSESMPAVHCIDYLRGPRFDYQSCTEVLRSVLCQSSQSPYPSRSGFLIVDDNHPCSVPDLPNL